VIPDEPNILIPGAAAGSEMDRLIKGINRQIARSILDLNTRLSEGSELTEQQDACLGTYDPAAGQQLLAIDCANALATGDVPIYVERASYYDTAQCHAAIFNGSANGCQLQTARISIPTQWIIPERPADSPSTAPNRPQPIAGVEIYYAINNSNIGITSNEEALTGIFQCNFNLLGSGSSFPLINETCDSSITLAANRFDDLLPE
jgi:hypothetical protein